MANRTKYKWTFPGRSENGSDVGFNEPMTENFKKHKYASLVRESIQNSLDVVLDNTKPVKVEFSIQSMGRGIDTKPFFDIKEHIKSCQDYFSHYDQANKIYGPMLRYLEQVDNEFNGRLYYIKVSDYNTTGMQFEQNNDNAFYAFVRAAGVSYKKDASSGGSFGFGKAAYFYLSAIRTLIVSTTYKDGSCYFEGVSSLCTHRMNGKKVEAIGYYDCNNGLPVTEQNQILSRFRRSDEDGKPISGTDINIMGIDLSEKSKEDIYQEMKLAVLRNFWLAIYDNRLEVTIGDKTISKSNIASIIESTFEEDEDNKHTYYYNPRPYFEAIKNVGTSNKYVKYEWIPDNDKNFQTSFVKTATKRKPSGKVELYLYKNKQGSNRILYMREPRMLVERKKHSTSNGFFGVLVAHGGYINEYLRLIENPAHNEWDTKIVSDKDYTTKTLIKQITEGYKNFVTESLSDLFKMSNGAVIAIRGLDQYLYIPTDVETEDDYEDSMEAYSADPVGELKDDGTSVTTDTTHQDIDKTNTTDTKTGNVVIKKNNTAEPNDNGDKFAGKSNMPTQKKGKGMGVEPNKSNIETANGKEGSYLELISVNYRSFAVTGEDGLIYHKIIIHTKNEIEKGQIHLEVGGDESTEIINIIYSNVGKTESNKVVDLSFENGKNTILIHFEDNLKHTIKLKAYENK